MWSKHDYLLEVKTELNNTRVYEKWCGNPFQNVNAKTKSVLRDILNHKEIDKKIIDYLLMNLTQLGRFCLLPKIHKGGIKRSWTTGYSKK